MNSFWPPPLIWQDETCYVLGGGPSLKLQDVNRLIGRRVIAVNSACYLAPWAPILLCNDGEWLQQNRNAVETWPQTLIATNFTPERYLPRNAVRVIMEKRADFPPSGAGVIRYGKSTGQIAVSLSIAFGASLIALLGFDMRMVEGRSNFHDQTTVRSETVYADSFIPAFKGWGQDATKRGVAIINATPGSALTEFPFRTLDQILAQEHGQR